MKNLLKINNKNTRVYQVLELRAKSFIMGYLKGIRYFRYTDLPG